MTDETMTDIAGLCERLRSMGRYPHKPYPTHFINPDGPEAADLIETQVERIAALEGALRPFADALPKVNERSEQHFRLGMGKLSDNASTGLGIKIRHIRDAAAALTGDA